MVFGLSPCRTSPLLTTMFAVPSFSFSGCLVGFVDAVLSSFLFLSGAGETQTFLWVCPCVLFFVHADSIFNPYAFIYPWVRLQPLFFFSFRRRLSLVWRWSVAFVWSLSSWGVFAGFVLSASSCLHMLCIREIDGGSVTIVTPLIIFMVVFWGLGWGPMTRMPPWRAELVSPPHPLPAECCKGRPRKGVGDSIRRQPYCHAM